jgi:NDP-sugar pyrophosphorylase family protein
VQCVILAGGLATRLRPLTEKIPKSMVPVGGKPFLEYQLDLLRRNGIRDIVLCIAHLGEQIVEYFGDGSRFGVDIQYSREKVRLGTGGAIGNALHLLGKHFMVMYGDSYLDTKYQDIISHFETAGYPAVLAVYRNEGKWDASNVVFDGDRVVLYDKRNRVPQMNYIDYGLSILSRKLFADKPGGIAWDLGDLYCQLAKDGNLGGYEVFSRFYEVGSKDGLRELEVNLSLEVARQP